MWKSRVTRFPDRSARGSAAAAGAVAGSAPAALVAQCEWWSWTVAVGRHTMELSCPPLELAKKTIRKIGARYYHRPATTTPVAATMATTERRHGSA